ncbi:hypothetical protein BCV69DRAFT_297094 [Microstroma glucosiphilum]|uniref:Transmembrane protein n=1 Tax=Pseudomicrostroma glucosiphilum TaxID=1684307 RepID=A0A316UDA5_9BASI|nr:hypothetical protein BCV69DRAFT_297094 [Pseudomicrostroma glucosiphilum]PWN23142.1 hypothetical protein BCV69DRAFT_297094 [Pseudomicrostroma glucosiphilum]
MALGDTLPWTRTKQVIQSASSPPREDASATSDTTERRDPITPTLFRSRIPIVPVAATIFLIGFTGAALYGVRAGRKAELKEAAEMAAKNHAATRHAATNTPSALSRAQPALNSSSTSSSRGTASGFDWGATGSSAPSALSRRGAGAASSPRGGFSASPAGVAGGQRGYTFEEPPAVTAIKAFTIATALVGVTSVAVVEVARRVWKVEDMYDLTDRLHDMAPKSFALFESVGNFMRARLGGIFPEPADKEDPFAAPVGDQSFLESPEGASHSSNWPHILRPATHVPIDVTSATAKNAVKPVEDLFEEIEQAPTMRAKLELVELQLRGEKAFEDQHREELRRQRELRGTASSRDKSP